MKHDQSYKLLFSHPDMVRDLLLGFVQQDWVQHCHFDSLEKVSKSFVSDDLRDREDDVIWRLRWGDEWLYVYLLLEFQSTVDYFMAVRVLAYVALLYQDLINSGEINRQQRLPPVLPVVLYNGQSRWQAPVDLHELIHPAPDSLAAYRPSIRYLLLDEGAYSYEQLDSLTNLVAALFQLENSRSAEDMNTVLIKLVAWLREPSQTGLRRAFTVWIKRVLLPAKVPGADIPLINDLQEMQTMLAERVKQWTEEWKQQGLAEGEAKGLAEGEAKGLAEGEAKGLAKGKADSLNKLLQLKFGTLPDDVKHQIEQADCSQLDTWLERILTTESLDAVFKREA